MNAITASRTDEAILIDTLLSIAPQAAYRKADCYGQLRCRLIDSGWTVHRFNHALNDLRHRDKLYVSNSKKSVSLIGFTQFKVGLCVYCNRRTRQLTRDHVLPKSRGGSNHHANIVSACQACNHVKGNRTPEEWARDILNYRRPSVPMTRLPIRNRLQLVAATVLAFVVGILKGGAA
jgi:5-methylcytosine-specific restriction endonuclease McrA